MLPIDPQNSMGAILQQHHRFEWHLYEMVPKAAVGKQVPPADHNGYCRVNA